MGPCQPDRFRRGETTDEYRRRTRETLGCILVYMSAVLSVRLPEETKKRLDDLSARTRRPVSIYVVEALEEHLADMEDYYMGIQALEEYRRDGVSYSLDEVMAEYGLDG